MMAHNSAYDAFVSEQPDKHSSVFQDDWRGRSGSSRNGGWALLKQHANEGLHQPESDLKFYFSNMRWNNDILSGVSF